MGNNINSRLIAITALFTILAFADMAHAQVAVAGDTCINPGGMIQTTQSHDGTDLLACVGQLGSTTWHSMALNPGSTNTVTAFNSANCPPGWSPYTALDGRTIIGAGNSGASGATTHIAGEIGGEETHILLQAELPNVQLDIMNTDPAALGGAALKAANLSKGWSPGPGAGSNGSEASTAGGGVTILTAPMGSGQPMNEMMPYVTLTYCSKN